jgi:hypothetical protein
VHGSNARNLSVWLLYPKLAKTLCVSCYPLCFLFNKIGEEGKTGSAWKWGVGGGREVAQTMYTNVSKHKNNKNTR